MRYSWIIMLLLATSCDSTRKIATNDSVVKPVAVTEPVVYDTDDPAIWINSSDHSKSLIIGTDKENGGGLYVFDLKGKIVNKVTGLQRPNNVDLVYNVSLSGKKFDLAITTERTTNRLRAYSIPDLQELPNDSLSVFEGEKERGPMGIAMYTRQSDGKIFVIVGRKSGPADGYLWQYELQEKDGKLHLELARKFGHYSGKKEIESIAVDNELDYIYYSDEQVGIRKYYADPAKGNDELALFGQGQYKEDNEGISVYKVNGKTGYILVSDQSANRFNVYAREGSKLNPHEHTLITSIPVSTLQSDGSDVTSLTLPGFPGGLFVAMSDDKTFQFYAWKDLAAKGGLKVK